MVARKTAKESTDKQNTITKQATFARSTIPLPTHGRLHPSPSSPSTHPPPPPQELCLHAPLPVSVKLLLPSSTLTSPHRGHPPSTHPHHDTRRFPLPSNSHHPTASAVMTSRRNRHRRRRHPPTSSPRTAVAVIPKAPVRRLHGHPLPLTPRTADAATALYFRHDRPCRRPCRRRLHRPRHQRLFHRALRQIAPATAAENAPIAPTTVDTTRHHKKSTHFEKVACQRSACHEVAVVRWCADLQKIS